MKVGLPFVSQNSIPGKIRKVPIFFLFSNVPIFSGFMHAHVSYLVEGSPVCLFMLTVERDIFFALSEARLKIVKALEKAGSIKKMEDLLQDQERLKSSTIGIPEIRHYSYKSKTTAQFLSSHDSTYDDVEAMNRLNNIHFILKTRLHSITRPYKLLYYSGSTENVIAWVKIIDFSISNIL